MKIEPKKHYNICFFFVTKTKIKSYCDHNPSYISKGMFFSTFWAWIVSILLVRGGGEDESIHNGKWIIRNTSNDTTVVTKRHEACFIMVNGFGYLIGGRGKNPTNVYDPKNNIWLSPPRSGPPIQLHHMQCVAIPNEELIYIVSAWTGGFPKERNVDKIYIYNIRNDTWTTRPGLPEERRRGGAASILVNRRIYVSHGNRGGHETSTNRNATSYGWLDYYDIDNNIWVTNLPDAPNPRDHTGGGLLQNRYICIAGGRDGGSIDFFNKVILPTDCYDIQTNTWSVRANIPSYGRAGSAYTTSCDHQYLIVAGGEGNGTAYTNVDVFDGTKWIQWDSLNIGRHGTGLGIDCTNHNSLQSSTCNNQIHIASGASTQGGRYEITSVETYYPNGAITTC